MEGWASAASTHLLNAGLSICGSQEFLLQSVPSCQSAYEPPGTAKKALEIYASCDWVLAVAEEEETPPEVVQKKRTTALIVEKMEENDEITALVDKYHKSFDQKSGNLES